MIKKSIKTFQKNVVKRPIFSSRHIITLKYIATMFNFNYFADLNPANNRAKKTRQSIHQLIGQNGYSD